MAEQHNGENKMAGFKPIRPKFYFGVWLRLHGVDLITMALMGGLALGVYQACEQIVGTIVYFRY